MKEGVSDTNKNLSQKSQVF